MTTGLDQRSMVLRPEGFGFDVQLNKCCTSCGAVRQEGQMFWMWGWMMLW